MGRTPYRGTIGAQAPICLAALFPHSLTELRRHTHASQTTSPISSSSSSHKIEPVLFFTAISFASRPIPVRSSHKLLLGCTSSSLLHFSHPRHVSRRMTMFLITSPCLSPSSYQTCMHHLPTIGSMRASAYSLYSFAPTLPDLDTIGEKESFWLTPSSNEICRSGKHQVRAVHVICRGKIAEMLYGYRRSPRPFHGRVRAESHGWGRLYLFLTADS